MLFLKWVCSTIRLDQDTIFTKLQVAYINTSEPSYIEVRNAIKNLKNGKAPGIDSLTEELLKADICF